ncbi:MAG: hypothetical protein CR967_03940 [Proteobacteria bacterium]|nr:MAG: hypothetical protein CR967_03940 [Pseudomonadota bacterium]
MEMNLVSEGLKFMALGMVTVFLFLILMVIVLKIQSSIIAKFFTKPLVQVPNSSTQNTQDDTALVAVISAAITQFKNQNKGR